MSDTFVKLGVSFCPSPSARLIWHIDAHNFPSHFNLRLFDTYLDTNRISTMIARLRYTSAVVFLLVGMSTTTNGLSVKPVRRSIKKTNHSNLFKTQTRPSPPDMISTDGTPGAAGPLHSAIAPSLPHGNANNHLNLYSRYLDWIERKPLVAKSVTAAVVGSLGDIMAQSLEAHMANVVFVMNYRRLAAFFTSGLLFVGPFLHSFYEVLGALRNYLDANVTKNKNVQALAQLFVDQTLGAMMFLPTYFYVFELCEAMVSFRGKRSDARCASQ